MGQSLNVLRYSGSIATARRDSPEPSDFSFTPLGPFREVAGRLYSLSLKFLQDEKGIRGTAMTRKTNTLD